MLRVLIAPMLADEEQRQEIINGAADYLTSRGIVDVIIFRETDPDDEEGTAYAPHALAAFILSEIMDALGLSGAPETEPYPYES